MSNTQNLIIIKYIKYKFMLVRKIDEPQIKQRDKKYSCGAL